MKPSRILFVALLVVAGLLFVLNPGEEKFREFLTVEVAQQASERAEEAVGGVAGGAAGEVAGFLADRLGRRAGDIASEAFTRDNYYVASVYKTDLNGRRPGGEVEFLGIANWFVPLKKLDV
jgi:hypothetical protein